MTFTTNEIWLALPEIYLTTALCVVLLFDLFFATKNPGRTATLTLLVLVVGAVLASRQVIADRQVILGGMYVADRLSSLLKTGAFLFTAMALFYSRDYLARRGIQKGEYYVLSLTALLGVLGAGLGGQQPADDVRGRRTAVAVAVRAGRVRSRFRHRRRSPR
jgi:NADH-quinone oxidoreductase subunit N